MMCKEVLWRQFGLMGKVEAVLIEIFGETIIFRERASHGFPIDYLW